MTGIPAPYVRANQFFLILSVASALLSGSYSLLILPLITGVVALAVRKNPIFSLVKPFLNKPLSQYSMEDALQQRFNQWIAVICLVVSLSGFALRLQAIGFIFSIMVAISAAIALMGFCIGCFIRFQFNQWRHKFRASHLDNCR